MDWKLVTPLLGGAALLAMSVVAAEAKELLGALSIESANGVESPYPFKPGTATVFWVGEEPSADNASIPNGASAWQENWANHYGGYDDPDHRNGYHPKGFTPKENPFYVALPYGEYDENGLRPDAQKTVPWYNDKDAWQAPDSPMKNQWVEIRMGDKVVYAQVEDVGPSDDPKGANDPDYVFGNAQDSKNTFGAKADIDVSPAVRDTLGMGDVGEVKWRFVPADQVPDGPWKKIVTRSGTDWK